MALAKQIFANTLFVADIPSSKNFYVKVFGIEPVFEDQNSAVFKFGETLINLLAQGEAPELIAPVQVANRESGARSQLTLHVENVDLEVTRLREIGVPLLNGPIDRPWGVRTALFVDLDGHLWELAQEITVYQ